MMDDPIAAAARAAAIRLAGHYGPGLATEVEAALHAQGQERRPEQYFDPVSIGALIVSIATLAWNIYNDLKTKTPNPTPDTVTRMARVELRNRSETVSAQQQEIAEVVITEFMRYAGDSR